MRSHFKQVAIAIFLCTILMVPPLRSQVPVSIAPTPKLQFLSNAGIPLANGCLFSYQSGTSTPQATYTDSTGTATNLNPTILDAGGRADVWLSNQSYKLVLKTAGGVNCASGSQIFSEDNISGFLGLLSLSNIWTNAQTFSQPITDTATINQIVLGTAPNQTTLNFPAPAGNVALTFPITTDTMVGRATTDTLTNKTLTSPVLNTPNLNGTVIPGLPATYFTMANDLVTGTTLNKLTKINPAGLAGFAILPLITDTGGIVGITVSGAGITGNATIQQNGSVSCVFDNATTSGNYIQISPTVVGDCHDAGVGYPSSGQVIGRSLATNAAIGTNIIDLFGPEIRAANISDYDNYTPIAYAVAAPGPNHSVSIPAGAVQNSAVIGSIIEVETSFHDGAHTGAAPTYVLSLNASTILTLTLVDATDYDIKCTIVLSSSSLARIEVVAMASTPSIAGMTRTVFGSLIDGSAPTIIADSFATATTITGTVDYMHVRVRK